MKRNNQGFHLLAIVLVVTVVGAVGLVGWKVASKKDKATPSAANSSQSSNGGTSSDVTWAFLDTWQPSSTPPACEDPISFDTPTPNLDKATAVLYPGQFRSTGYKTHGGFLFGDSNNGDISVTVPRDGHLIFGSRYIEQGDVQYFFVFSSPCGIIWRFDHLLTLSPKFQAIADKLPTAKVDDSRTTNLTPPVSVKKGEVVATAVGFKTNKNVGFDFGVYDVRSKNEVSRNADWSTLHASDQEFAPYGVCWFDLLGAKDSVSVKSLPAGDGASGKTSDYCK
ncbi:MAG: hypothetical protein Q7R60_01790 [bacterium]|nr:hypothetical protein [bacterium]